jgi:predicted RNA binding protein YcfA (HicA-like mRNA interferase family)
VASAERIEWVTPAEQIFTRKAACACLNGALAMRTAIAIIRRLLEDGWLETKGRGSHRNFRHPKKPGKVTVPFHGSRDLPVATIRSIERQSGLDLLLKR